LLDNTLEGRILYLFLGIYELDIVLGGLLVIVGCDKVATAVCYAVVISQKLLLVIEISLEYIGFLFRVKYIYFLFWDSSSIEAV